MNGTPPPTLCPVTKRPWIERIPNDFLTSILFEYYFNKVWEVTMNCISKWLSCVQGVDSEVFSSVTEGLWLSTELLFGNCFQKTTSSRINVEPFSNTVSRSCNASTHLHQHQHLNAGCLATTWRMMNLLVAKKRRATHPKTTDYVCNIPVCVWIKTIKIQHIN